MRTLLNMLRVPNLLIIAFTFFLLRYLVFLPVYTAYSVAPVLNSLYFTIMVAVTLLIAAAGYISNDYFDVVTDRVNKPLKQYIGKYISPGSALATAILLSLLSMALAFWLTFVLNSWIPAMLFILALSVAWWYAIQLKRSFMWGNIAVACMSAGTIVLAWLIEKQSLQITGEPSKIISGMVAAISIFAFLLSLMREIIKDAEDIEGDRLIQCRSLPIVKGIPFTKTFIFLTTILTFLLLIIAQIYMLQFSRIAAVAWLFISVEMPLLFFIAAVKKARIKSDYHKASSLLKWIMLGGIASIIAGQF